MRVLPLLLVACSAKGGTENDSDTASDEIIWEVIDDAVPDGVLLSAWSDGDTLRIVGGDLGGGPGLMVHGEPGTLCLEREITDRALWWIHGPAPGHWYAVGETGTVLRQKDGVQDRIDVPTDATLFGVWATETEVWVAGGHIGAGLNAGEIWRWNGSDWTAIATELPGVLFKVWDGWFVGQDVRYQWVDGALLAHPLDGRLLTIRGRAHDDVWAVGGLMNALIHHWDGTSWTEQSTTGLGQAINGVWTGAEASVWVGGNFGVTAEWTESAWVQPERPLTTDHLHGVWRHGDSTWWVGGDLFNVGDNHGVILRHGPSTLAQDIDSCD
jgi:hypothetical protein